MVGAAARYIGWLEEVGFRDIVISLKASTVPLTVRAYELAARRFDYPLHLGLTEAGTPGRGIIRSAVAIGHLLGLGLGDTIRVSLTGDPLREVEAGRMILAAWDLGPSGLDIISCPTCGRARGDVAALVEEVETRLAGKEGDLTIAVMGCEVNGPGEARHADVGLACGAAGGVLFRTGRPAERVPAELMVERLVQAVEEELEGREGTPGAGRL